MFFLVVTKARSEDSNTQPAPSYMGYWGMFVEEWMMLHGRGMIISRQVCILQVTWCVDTLLSSALGVFRHAN